MLLDNIRTALESLFGNRLRSFLTLLGVVIGVFAVTATISMGSIATAGITGELESLGSQQLFIVREFDDPRAGPFTDEDIEALSRLPVDVVQQQSINALARVAGSDDEASLSIDGTTANLPDIDGTLELAQGRYFTETEAEQAAPVIVLSDNAASDLFDEDANPIGQEVVVSVNGSRTFYTVIGVKEPIGGALGAIGANQSQGDIPLEAFYISYPFIERGEYDFLAVAIDLDRNADDIEAQVRAILDRRRGSSDTYSIQKIEGILSVFNTITVILQVVLGGIGAISLLVGGIGILNIMLVSVTERTREIGLRKALGAKKGTILQQFLIEAIVLTVIGGVLGVLLAIASLYIIVAAVPFLDRVIINPWVVLLAFGVSVATGVIFGLLPANRAANLSPIEALRYE